MKITAITWGVLSSKGADIVYIYTCRYIYIYIYIYTREAARTHINRLQIHVNGRTARGGRKKSHPDDCKVDNPPFNASRVVSNL